MAMNWTSKSLKDSSLAPVTGNTEKRSKLIDEAFERLIITSRAQALQKCKVANEKTVKEVQKIVQQYQRQVAAVQSRNQKMVESVLKKYRAIELTNEASLNQLHEWIQYIEEKFDVYCPYDVLRQETFQYNDEIEIDPNQSIDEYLAVMEQLYQSLDLMLLPRLFLWYRPFRTAMGYCAIVTIVMTMVHRYQLLSLSTHYICLLIALVLGLAILGAVGRYLWQITKRELQAIYNQFKDTEDSAAALLQLRIQETQQMLDADLQRVQQTTDTALSKLYQAKTAAYERINATRDTTYRKIGKELLVTEQSLKNKRNEAHHQ